MANSNMTLRAFLEPTYCIDPVWPNSPDVSTKLEHVKRECVEDHCYLWLIFLIGVAADLGVRRFSEQVAELKKLGPQPLGKDIIDKLLVMQAETLVETRNTDLLWPLGSGCFRFQVTDFSGVLHLTVGLIDGCECEKHLCDHGWSPTAILCLLANPTLRVGSTINFSDLFEGDETQPLRSRSPESKMRAKEKESGLDQEELASDLELFARSLRMQNKGVPPGQGARPDTMVEEQTLLAEDSSSNLGRYHKTYMRRGEVYAGTLPPIDEISSRMMSLREEAGRLTLLPGFGGTLEHHESEVQALSRLRPIRGLASPFKEPRLNFLCNLYTAMAPLRRLGPDTFMQRLWSSVKGQDLPPKFELLKLVLAMTFDKKNLVVVSNHFDLPYIEVGMEITEDCMVKCFDLLENCYELQWFAAMKEIQVPSFHDKYRRLSTSRKSSDSHSGSSQRSSSSELSSKQRTGRRGSGSTLLSYLSS